MKPDVTTVRTFLMSASDTEIEQFLHGYSLGCIADFLLSCLNESSRAGAFAEFRSKWPQYWESKN